MRARTAMGTLVMVLGWTTAGRASCPIGMTLVVDNDIAGSGYSEEKSDNWTSYEPFACKAPGAAKNTFRYLTKYSGDGSSTGKAIWKPAITVAGLYEVVTSYRASDNRTEDADYYLQGDSGEKIHQIINQKGSGSDAVCTYATLGQVTCLPGGSCRLVLDGDDKLQSASADVTTFKLLSCLEQPPVNQPPTGALDHVGCDHLSGWGYDPDQPSTPTEVHVYFGGTPGSPSVALGLPLQASIPRDDLCGVLGSCAHAFFVPFPDSLRDGVSRPVHAYAIDLGGGANTELPGSPMTIACSPLPQGGSAGSEASGGSSGSAAGTGGSAGQGGASSGGSAAAGGSGWPGPSSGAGGSSAGEAGGQASDKGGAKTLARNEEATADGGCAVRSASRGNGGWLVILALFTALGRAGRRR